MKDIVFSSLLGLITLWFGYVVIKGFINGVFYSRYGEAMTVRRSEEPIGFFIIGAVYAAILFWLMYIEFKYIKTIINLYL
jgi:hypothetical protein